jgi:chromatin remodeling complex protein RSC6
MNSSIKEVLAKLGLLEKRIGSLRDENKELMKMKELMLEDIVLRLTKLENEMNSLQQENTEIRNSFLPITTDGNNATTSSWNADENKKEDEEEDEEVEEPPLCISDGLAAFLEKSSGIKMKPTEVIRDINKYIRTNKLQDPKNATGHIIPDAKLSALLNLGEGEELTYFNLWRILFPHFEEECNRANAGFVKPTRISDELAIFLEKSSGSEMARTEVTRDINLYIRAHKLQDPKNGRKIIPDAKLSVLLKLGKDQELTYFNLQRFLSPHFAKKQV